MIQFNLLPAGCRLLSSINVNCRANRLAFKRLRIVGFFRPIKETIFGFTERQQPWRKQLMVSSWEILEYMLSLWLKSIWTSDTLNSPNSLIPASRYRDIRFDCNILPSLSILLLHVETVSSTNKLFCLFAGCLQYDFRLKMRQILKDSSFGADNNGALMHADEKASLHSIDLLFFIFFKSKRLLGCVFGYSRL